MSTFDFTTLSPDLIIDGLEHVGFTVDSGLLALNSYENRVYQFTDNDDQKFVTKFYRPQRWCLAQLQEEHDFGFDLIEQELPVIAPIKINGQSLFEYKGFQFAVYPCRGGRIFEVDNLDQLEWMGRFVGRIHAVGAQKPFQHRDRFNTDEMLIEAKKIIEQSNFVPVSLYTAFFTILDLVIELTTAQYLPTTEIRLHGDCHAGNILWREGHGPHFVDLDDCRTGPAIQDLWMMLSGDRQEQQLQIDTILAGYEEYLSLTPAS